MSMQIASINSGSNGNCYYVGTATEAILVDVGISCKEVEKRMKHLNLAMKNVKAIFISHEHTDHIKGLAVLAKKYSLPVYITKKTRRNWIKGISHLFNDFKADERITIGELIITPFEKKHDALDPHSFIISHKATTVGVFTDIGIVCDEVIKYFKQCNAIFLESNYEEEMLENGSYPLHLKNRIKGGEGHLSNKQALELFLQHKPKFMTHILLSHLSKENNHPELAKQLFLPHADNVLIEIASRYEASNVYHIENAPEKTFVKLKRYVQAALFE